MIKAEMSMGNENSWEKKRSSGKRKKTAIVLAAAII